MEHKNVITKQNDEILLITINREEKLNALNNQLISELHEVLKLAAENRLVGGVIITGAGKKAFIAGADIAEFKNMNADEGKKLAAEGQEKVFNLIEKMGKPVIAAINGFALGGGLELAMACQIRICTQEAKMGLPEVTLGLIPGYGGTQRLTQLVGKGKALEMILSGSFISADEALQYGLVNKVTPAVDLLDEAFSMMRKITKNSPDAVFAAIKAVNASLHQDGYASEIDLFGKCFGTENSKEGISAFIEKRKPVFMR